MNLDIDSLRCFVMAASCLNFTKAAELLYSTQSTVSRRIAQIEKDMGVELFERSGPGLRLTGAGEVFLEEARRVIARIDELPQKLQRVSGGISGKVRIGHYGYFDMPLVFELIRRVKQTAPGIEIETHARMFARITEGLEQKELDIAINMDSEFERLRDAEIQRISPAHICALVPDTHPLAAAGSIVMNDLRDEPIVWWKRFYAPGIYDRMNQACIDNGFAPVLARVEPTANEVAAAVASGVGAGLLLDRIAKTLAGSSCVVLPIRDLSPQLYYAAACMREDRSSCVQAVWDILCGMTKTLREEYERE